MLVFTQPGVNSSPKYTSKVYKKICLMYYARVHIHAHALGEGSVPQLESEKCKQRDMHVENIATFLILTHKLASFVTY